MKNLYQPLVSALLLVLTFAWSGQVYAQEVTVSGKVTSAEDGEGVPGVNVLIKGTNTGAVTDFDGNYKLNAPSSSSVLIFSFIGYATQEVVVGNQSTINVALQSDVTALEEVVVVGYGTTTKKEITSAVVSVKEEDFNQGNVNDPAQLLQGKAPGLSIVKNNGANPNSDFNIRIRGLATIGPNNQPLIIIDGVYSNSLSQVDPADIAAMDVLKDGAAAAIYGTRGSNGVIIVTTKNGRQGTAEISYNGYVSFEDIAKTVPVLDAAGYRENGGPNDFNSSTDWFDNITNTGVSQVHNLALSGGTAQTKYRMSVNFRDVGGVQQNTGWQQINSRFNITQKALNDKLTLTGNMALFNRESQYGFNDVFRYATIYNPTEPVRVTAGDNTSGLDPANFTRWDGFYQNVQFDYYNPVAIQEQNVNEGTGQTLNFYIKGNYEFIDGLNFDMSYAQQYYTQLQGQYYDKNSFWVGANRNGLAQRNTDDRFTEIFESTLNFDRDFNDMNLKVLGGYTWQQGTNEGFSASGGNFVTDKFSYNNLSGAQDFDNGLGTVSSYKNQQTLIAFYGRVNLNWSDTYFLMASYRHEGSSQFGENNKWGGFPAVSAGVAFSNIFDMGGTVDNLKLRLSYGETGNLPSEPYLSLPRLGPTGNAFVNGSFQPAFGPVSNANPNLKWETKREFDVGVDFAFIDYRLNGSIDYYQRNTSDLLLYFDVPVPPNLFPQTWLNIGDMSNSGFELGVSYLLVDNANVNYTVGFNYSTYDTKLNSLSSEEEGLQFGDRRIITGLGAPGQNGTLISLVEEGQPIGNLWGPVIVEGQPVDENGDWNIEDINGDNVINLEDETTIGNGLPSSELGWSNVVTAGNWDFNVFFRGVFGHDLLNTFRAFYENPNLIGSYNVLESSFDEELQGLNGNVNKYGSYHVEDASFFKLDNASVGYNFSLPDGAAFKKIRLYLTGQNLFVITNYSGVDPEVRYADGGNVLSPGIDRRNTWFRSRTYTFGVQLGF